jgi:hypothetical protein
MRGSRALLFAFALVALVRAQTTPISYIVKYRESVPQIGRASCRERV